MEGGPLLGQNSLSQRPSKTTRLGQVLSVEEKTTFRESKTSEELFYLLSTAE